MSKKINLLLILSLLIVTGLTMNSYYGTSASENEKFYLEDTIARTKAVEFNDFESANKALLESPDSTVIKRANGEVLAAKPNQAYAYKDISSNSTYNIYYNKELTSELTYVTGQYKMYYYGTHKVGNKFVAEIEIQGAHGYVSMDSLKLVNFANGEFKDDVYKVANREVSYYYYKMNGESASTTYAQAPNWLKDGTYFSPDGIHFYTDRTLRNPVKDGDKQGEFYAYYQWLPVRSLSNITGMDINEHLTQTGWASKSVITDNEQAFIANANKYGMNALLIYAQAALESAYGASWYAVNRYNLFGWNAFDSNPDLASTYEGVDSAVKRHVGSQLGGYFNIQDGRNRGLSFGNKGSGISVKYASDPNYGIKVAGIAYNLDRMIGFKDYNAYNLAKIDDNQDLNIRKGPGINYGVYYTHPARPQMTKDQIRTDLGSENGFIKTNVMMNIKDGEVYMAYINEQMPLNLLELFEYFSEDYATRLPKHGPTKAKPVTSIVTVSDNSKKMVVDASSVNSASLNMRSGWSTDYTWLASIPNGTEVDAYFTTNNWAKVHYNGLSGYVSKEFLKEISETNPPKPTEPNNPPKYKLGDVNGDGKIDGFDMMAVKRHFLNIKKLKGDQLKAADINKDGNIDGFDMMAIKRHFLNIKQIVE